MEISIKEKNCLFLLTLNIYILVSLVSFPSEAKEQIDGSLLGSGDEGEKIHNNLDEFIRVAQEMKGERLSERCRNYWNMLIESRNLEKEQPTTQNDWSSIFEPMVNRQELDLWLQNDLRDCLDHWSSSTSCLLRSSVEQQETAIKFDRMNVLLESLIEINDENEAKINQLSSYLSDKEDELAKREALYELTSNQMSNEHRLQMIKMESKIEELACENDEAERIKKLERQLVNMRRELTIHHGENGSGSSGDEKRLEMSDKFYQVQRQNVELDKRSKKCEAELNKLLEQHGRVIGDHKKLIDLNNDLDARIKENLSSLQLCQKDKESLLDEMRMKLGLRDATCKIDAKKQATPSYLTNEDRLNELIKSIDEAEERMIYNDGHMRWLIELVGRLRQMMKTLKDRDEKLHKRYKNYYDGYKYKSLWLEKMNKKMAKIMKYEKDELNDFKKVTKGSLKEWKEMVDKLDKMSKRHTRSPIEVKKFLAQRFIKIRQLSHKIT